MSLRNTGKIEWLFLVAIQYGCNIVHDVRRSYLFHFSRGTDVVVCHQIKTIDPGKELMILREIRSEWLAQLQKQVDEVENEAIGCDWGVREHFLLIHVDCDGHSHPIQNSVFAFSLLH